VGGGGGGSRRERRLNGIPAGTQNNTFIRLFVLFFFRRRPPFIIVVRRLFETRVTPHARCRIVPVQYGFSVCFAVQNCQTKNITTRPKKRRRSNITRINRRQPGDYKNKTVAGRGRYATTAVRPRTEILQIVSIFC